MVLSVVSRLGCRIISSTRTLPPCVQDIASQASLVLSAETVATVSYADTAVCCGFNSRYRCPKGCARSKARLANLKNSAIGFEAKQNHERLKIRTKCAYSLASLKNQAKTKGRSPIPSFACHALPTRPRSISSKESAHEPSDCTHWQRGRF